MVSGAMGRGRACLRAVAACGLALSVPARAQQPAPDPTELDPSAPLVVYCQSGGRSAQACGWLSSQGFGHVSNLHGGIVAWVREGHPLTRLS